MALRELINNAQQLPQLPKIVQELIESFNDDDVDINAITKKIASDQALTAKVMRAANSAHYGGNRKIGSVNDAAVLMGFNALRTLVLASGLSSAFKAPPGFDLNQFWRRNFVIANACRWLARQIKIDADTAYTCGLMANVGTLLIHTVRPEEAAKIDSAVNAGGNQVELEEVHLGFTHAEAGAELANRWKFPEEMAAALADKIAAQKGESEEVMANVIAAGEYMADNLDTGADSLAANFPAANAKVLNFDPANISAKADQVEALDAGLGELLS